MKHRLHPVVNGSQIVHQWYSSENASMHEIVLSGCVG